LSTKFQHALPTCSPFNFILKKFLSVTAIPNYLNCATFWRINYISLCHDFSLYSADETATYNLYSLHLLLKDQTVYFGPSYGITEAKLKSNSDRTSLCFRPFWIGTYQANVYLSASLHLHLKWLYCELFCIVSA
jgi:hypothetical protein